MAAKQQTSKAAYEARRQEALELLGKLSEHLSIPYDQQRIDWGHVGNMTDLMVHLKRAAYWAGVPGHEED